MKEDFQPIETYKREERFYTRASEQFTEKYIALMKKKGLRKVEIALKDGKTGSYWTR